MKSNKKFWMPVIALVFILPTLTLWQRSRAEAQVSILPVSAGQSAENEKATVRYRVNGSASDFTIIVLPDTQYYSQKYPEIYTTQTQWIRDNRDALNIVFVTHVGDIVQNNDKDEAEWQLADSAMSMLDGVVPYGILPGNHDMAQGGVAKFYEQYFPSSRFEGYNWWGGSFDNNRYNYQLFSAGGDEYVILHMQYCPTNASLEWANGVLAEFPDRKAIVSTHSYLLTTGELVKNCQSKSNGDATGQKIWNRLIKRNQNVFMVLSGHIPGVGRLDTYEGRMVYQLLSDYQADPLGGGGYLRIMTFDPQKDMIRVSTYSPYLDQYMEDENNKFDLAFDMTGGVPAGGYVLLYSGLNFCIGSVAQGKCELKTDADTPIKAVYLGDIQHKASVFSVVPSTP